MEELKEELKKYYTIINNAKKQIAGAEKMIASLRETCPHKNLEHFRQEYVGRWTNCKDCGKEDV